MSIITKTSCKNCEFKDTKNCPYYGNEASRILECHGHDDLNCNHIITNNQSIMRTK